MRSKLEVLWGGALFASVLILGGCVAQATDQEDEAVDEAVAPALAEDGEQVGANDEDASSVPTRLPLSLPSSGEAAGSRPGDDCMSNPEPNPWHDRNQRTGH